MVYFPIFIIPFVFPFLFFHQYFPIFYDGYSPRAARMRHEKTILFQFFISHNVPAVYDVLAARISKCVAFAGPTKCGWSEAWEWSVAK
jgi:hypothetical protein